MNTFGVTFLRISMALMVLWFGFQQISDPMAWVGFLPDWSQSLHLYAQPKTLIMLNGWFEIFFGILLFFGFYTRFAAAMLAIHLLGITVSIGYDAIGVRDAGLTAALIAVACIGGGRYTLDTVFDTSEHSNI